MEHGDAAKSTEWLLGGGESGDLIRSMDWSRTPLGPREQWSSCLRTALAIVVESQFPMALLWGGELILLYNDAYRMICADRHPRAMGRSTREIWPEVWHINEPIFAAVLERGESVYLEDKLFPIDRGGHREDAYFTLCYSPVRGDDGLVAGSLVTLLETTRRVEAMRSSEAELRRERAFLRTVIDSISSMVMVKDAAGRCLLANEAAARFHGMTVQALEGRDCQEVSTIPPEAHESDKEALATGKERTGELDIVAADGQRHFVITSRIPLLNDEGVPDRVLATAVDITWRKRAERALRESEERFRIMADGSPVIIWVTDRGGGFEFVNRTYREFFGVTYEEVAGGQWQPLVHPDDAVAYVGALREAIRTRTAFEAEARVRRADGEWRWVASHGEPRFSASGAFLGHAGISPDITERKRAELALRASEEKFARAFHGNRAAMTMTRLRDGLYIDVNDRWVEATGFTREEAIGHTASEMDMWRHADDRAEFVADLRRHGMVQNAECLLVRRGGEEWTALVSSQVIEIEGEQVIISSISDITTRKQAEEVLKMANKALAEADRQKDEFIAILSHELRNPLAPIRYALPLLQRERLSEPVDRAVAVIDRQVAHLTRLVDDLLDISRITRGKIELRREHVTVASVVKAAAEAVSPVIAAARHQLRIVVPEESIWVHADVARLSQIVTNLLTNSAKYTPHGGEITLEAARDDGYAVIRVRDNGIGIPSEDLQNIFEMFRQVRRADRSQGGLGVGLALVKQLVEMHGGAIEAHSAGTGHGAELVVRLPVATELRREGAGDEAPVPSHGRSLKVLVVDDNADLVEMLAMVVEGLGHQVRKALDGRSALAAAKAYRPDVVLLDIGLPVMSGLEVARELRRQPETARARLIALTGWGQAEDRQQTANAGFDEHLTKPADPKTVARLLADI